MADKLACNINFFFYLRFVFGFYHKFQISKLIRWLARFYCCLVCGNIIFFFYYLGSNDFYYNLEIDLISLEYLVYIIFSLLEGNKYLLRYYKKTLLIDEISRPYRLLQIYLSGYICILFLFKVVASVDSVRSLKQYDILEHVFIFFEFVIWLCILLGRLPLSFVFALFYTRVRFMRQALESNNFEFGSHGKYHPRRFIQMYEAIMDGLEEINRPIKLQFFVFAAFLTTYCLSGSLFFINFMKNSADYEDYNNYTLFWYIAEIFVSCSPIFLSAILADLVTVEMQEMQAIVLERRIACKNDCNLEEIQKLFQFLKSKPFKYSLWRMVPLNVRSLLSFLSFCFTSVIATLQIQGWSS